MRTGTLQYSMWEFEYDSGKLKLSDGNLLGEFGIEAPRGVSDFKKQLVDWPIGFCDKTLFKDKVFSFLESGNPEYKPQFTYQMQIGNPDESNWVNVIAINMFDGTNIYKRLFFTPIDDYKSEINDILINSNKDPLTGCMNRMALQNVVEEMLLDEQQHAFIMFDIDNFKSLNDTFGHATGDKMLVNIVKRIKKELGPMDHIGRIGGDEFFICLDRFISKEETEHFARNLCMTVRRGLPNGMILSVSMGIVIAPDDGDDFDELYHKADIAMYSIKNTGGNSVLFYSDIDKNSNQVDAIEESVIENSTLNSDKSILIRFFYGKSDIDSRHKNDYIFSDSVNELFDFKKESSLLHTVRSARILSDKNLEKVLYKIRSLLNDKKRNVGFLQSQLMTKAGIQKWYDIGLIKEPRMKCLYITLTDINEFVVKYAKYEQLLEYDELTHLYTRRSFVQHVQEVIHKNNKDVVDGKYALLFFDVSRFKMINDILGMDIGDHLLKFMSDSIYEYAQGEFYPCRIDSDRFVLFMRATYDEINAFVEHYCEAVADYSETFRIVCNFGIYVTDGSTDSVEIMIDRAAIAQSSIKGSYIEKSNFYGEIMRNQLVSEQEIVSSMAAALEKHQFIVYYQPQFNHLDTTIVGAEALVRWRHPEKGLISPATFIGIFEKNGFITELDLFVFEETCKFIRYLLNTGITPVPISINISRCDIFRIHFIENIEKIRKSYDIDTKYIRLEITETIMAGESLYANEVITQLHKCGYIIEMDDFGTGYSSLTVLKDINMDILKLDFKFMSGDFSNERAGTILSSILRMARWLDIPVIAEGVELLDQADFLQSIGCNYIQGYLYSKPIPADEFVQLLRGKKIDKSFMKPKGNGNMRVRSFWTPNSPESKIFNNFVGAAAIIEMSDSELDIIRINSKYLEEIGREYSESLVLSSKNCMFLDDENRERLLRACKEAKRTKSEVNIETWRDYSGQYERGICIKSKIKFIGTNQGSYIFCEMIENITDRKLKEERQQRKDDVIRYGCRTGDIYLWEYDIENDVIYPITGGKDTGNLPDIILDLTAYNEDSGVFSEECIKVLERLQSDIRKGAKQVSSQITLRDGNRYLVQYSTCGTKEKYNNKRAMGFAFPLNDKGSV
ncbi:MAG: bifunctional diguanylate cyclase/phosphodiesterase [Clostridia bacterium]|nr:bifunctional diguanylate cyclase/phosphodiesterase [Clostridia bacterium]